MTAPEIIYTAINSQPVLHAVGWALVHSLWQGTLVALAYAAFSVLVRDPAANLRHAAGCVALLLMLVLPALTASVVLRSSSASIAGESGAGISANSATRFRPSTAEGAESAFGPSVGGEAEREIESSSPEALRAWINSRFVSGVPWLVLFWLAGVALLLLRFAAGYLGVRTLVRNAAPVAGELHETLERLVRRLRITRAVRVCESALVEVPTVVGHFKPLVLFPACALTGLSPAQLEAVLAHELAHIRRHDYLFNLLQTTVETLLFYHPAAWWLSRRVRVEREHASDDIAVAGVGDVLVYANALATLEQLRRSRVSTPALALAANGGSLMIRIRRLTNDKQTIRNRAPLAASALILTTLGVAIFAAHAMVPIEIAHGGELTTNPAASVRREVSITFVSFPGNNIYSDERLRNKTRKLMRGLKAHNIQSVAFVNEARLYKSDGEADEVRVGLLGEWLDAGHDLGNETFRHTSLYHASVAEFRAEVEQGEKIMSKLLSERGRRLRYFSYPYLNTGSDAEKKLTVEKYLRGRGYQIHPVTIDNMDWLFNSAYLEALRREDEAAAAAIRDEYIPYMERMFEFTEAYSLEIVGREFPQVLMLTAGALNADCFEDLVVMMKRRGYSFVTMEQATKDEAYRLPDNYTGVTGDSWIARWAATKGLEYKDTEEVNLPEYMQQYFKEYRKQQSSKK